MARALLIDPFSGAAGDMFLGALVGLGAGVEDLRQGLETLPIDGWTLDAEPVRRAGFAALKARVRLDALGGEEESRQTCGKGHRAVGGPARAPAEILDLIARSGLPGPAQAFATRTFTLLTEAEARVHGTTADLVHFHEVGAVDAIIDICGTALGMHLLGVEAVYSRPIATGSGTVETAHGTLPIPAPATLELLQGLPCVPTDLQGELVTPTGAALLRALEPRFTDWPVMRVMATACGAGNDDRPERANVLRLSLAEPMPGDTSSTVAEIVFEVDDMTPEELGALRRRIPRELLLDLSFSPCQMKKDRPGQRVTLLVPVGSVEDVAELIFRHTTTFGFRTATRDRTVLDREFMQVETPWGTCSVKIGRYGGSALRVHPEADEVATLAERAGISFREVSETASRLAWERL